MKKYLKFFLLLLLTIRSVWGYSQSYPVQITTILTPPYSLYLSDYASSTGNALQVMVQLRDLDRPDYRVKLRLTIEGQGIVLQTKPSFMPRSFLLQGGIPEVLTGADLSAYLNPDNLDFSGISKQEFIKRGTFPEGFYTFKVEAIDYQRNIVVSNAGFANAWIILNDPPLINLPFNNDKVAATNPQNIIFSWTPRHSASPNAAFTTEYEFTLVELYPANRNPNDAIRASNSIYTTRITSTSLNYGMMEPLLIAGRKYAFRIRAMDTEKRDLFKNDGYSEVFVFQFGDACLPPRDAKGVALDQTRIKVTWTGLDMHTGFGIKYRKAGTVSWQEENLLANFMTIPGLQPGETYEYQINGTCGTMPSNFTTIAQVKTPEAAHDKFSCGATAPAIELKTTPIQGGLKAHDVIHTADFNVLIKTLTANADGSYKGTGMALIPWLKFATANVKFTSIKVNEDHRVYDGNITTQYTKDSRFIAVLDLKSDELNKEITKPDATNSAPVAFNGVDMGDAGVITGITVDPVSGVMQIAHQDGTTTSVPRKTDGNTTDYKDTRITDKDGNTWMIDKKGEVHQGPNVAAPTAVATHEEVNFNVNFSANDGQFYGFDTKTNDLGKYDNALVHGYPYSVAWKAVELGRQDYVNVYVNNQNTFPSSVGFKTEVSPVPSQPASNGSSKQLFITGNECGVESVSAYAIVHESGKEPQEVELGKLNVQTYAKVTKRLFVVPVGDDIKIDANTLATEVNRIYQQGVARWDISIDKPFMVDAGLITDIDKDESGTLSSYNTKMRQFNEAFKKDRSIDKNAFYIFLIKGSNSTRKGIMPFNRGFGYVFTDQPGSDITAIAHELGHGAFNLRHTFDEFDDVAERSTDNLMDYKGGTELKKYQWDNIHDPELVLTWFQDDEASAYQPWEFLDVGITIPGIPDVRVDGSVSFISPAGVIFTVPTKVRDISFKSGFLTAFTLDNKRYVSVLKKDTKNFSGYALDGDGSLKQVSEMFKEEISKTFNYSEEVPVYFVLGQAGNCDNLKLFRGSYKGAPVNTVNSGYNESNNANLIKNGNDDILNGNLIAFNASDFQAIKNNFNCWSNEIKFLYKYIENKHGINDKKNIAFLDGLAERLSEFKSISISGMENHSTNNLVERWALNLDEYGGVTTFNKAITDYFKEDTKHKPKETTLVLILKDTKDQDIFSTKLTDLIPFIHAYESYVECLRDNTLGLETYVPYCTWKDSDIPRYQYYTMADLAFIAGFIDGGADAVHSVYSTVKSARNLYAAYTDKNFECQLSPEGYLTEYTKLANGLKNVIINFNIPTPVSVIIQASEFVESKEALKMEREAYQAIKDNTNISDENIKYLVDKLKIFKNYLPDQFEVRDKQLTEFASLFPVKNLPASQEMSCEDARKIRDQTIEFLKLIEQLTSPIDKTTREKVYSILADRLEQYVDETLSTDNVARYNHGRIVFEVASTIVGFGGVKLGEEFTKLIEGLSKLTKEQLSIFDKALSKRLKVGTQKFANFKNISKLPENITSKLDSKEWSVESLEKLDLDLADDALRLAFVQNGELAKAWKVLDDAGVDDAIRRNLVRLGEIDNYLVKNPGTEAVIKQGLNDVGQYKDEFLNGIRNATKGLSHLNGRSALPNEISDAVVKIKQYRNSKGNTSIGNYGYLEGNVNGNSVDNKMWPSGAANTKTEPQIFDAIEVKGVSGTWLRNTDSEYKMLNKLASDLGGIKGQSYSGVTGTLKIVSENPYCGSCQGVIHQFNQMFPNIKLILVDGVR